MADSEPAKKGGLTRREWLRLGVAAGAGAAAGALGAYQVSRLLGPPAAVEGEVRDIIYHVSYQNNEPIAPSTPVRVTDLQEWQGAPGLWRAVFSATPTGSSYLAGSGLPVLVIRVKRDDATFSAPLPAEFDLPAGFGLFYDDPARDTRIVVLFDRCTHLCCKPSWHTTPVPASVRNYLVPPPTYTVYGQDPIYCACHDAQFDPMVLVKDVHPNGPSYVGARQVYLTAVRALPIVPVRAEGDILIGGTNNLRWYTSYCG